VAISRNDGGSGTLGAKPVTRVPIDMPPEGGRATIPIGPGSKLCAFVSTIKVVEHEPVAMPRKPHETSVPVMGERLPPAESSAFVAVQPGKLAGILLSIPISVRKPTKLPIKPKRSPRLTAGIV